MTAKKKSLDIILLILCIIPVLSLDKLYKKDWKIWLIKLVSHILVIGFIWWIFDIVTCCIGKYKVNPLK